jgi:aspartokinase-like uncharacterized kinase
MKEALPTDSAMTVIKIGGGIAAIPSALERVCQSIQEAARLSPIVVVPGGGPFAGTVREFDRASGLSASAAHWMAILAMDQYAHVLADHMQEAVLIEDPGAVVEITAQGKLAVLAPFRWMRSADVLPHSWDVTSDSIAAFIAGALGAVRLILIKPVSSGVVDPYFATALPAGLCYRVLSWDRIETISSELSG